MAAALLVPALGSPVASARAFEPHRLPQLDIPRTDAAIEIDGNLDDPGWLRAAHADGFTETFPGDQVQPPVDTEVWVTYDESNLYLAFLAHDDPASVRASLRDRDQIWQDDFVGIILDTYGTGAWAYEIFVNPLGIQGDLRWTPNGEDMRFDLVFDSRGRITDDGWQAEMAIPFRSLRFPATGDQRWRATFHRNHPRDSRRRYSWASTDRDEPCWPCQFGTLTGIADVAAGGALELLPSVVGFQSSRLRDEADPHSGLHDESPDGSLSLGARYSLSSSLSAEATLNPDFSQVESDAAQIDVNTTFALFFPERRPFFQEGSDLYNTWISTVYTRSINDPSFAGKLTGRMGHTSVAYLGARDESSPIILPFEERSVFLQGGRSFTNVLRARHTFLDDSHIGALVTDRRLDGGGSGTNLGIDGQLRFLRNLRVEYQIVGSHTDEPENAELSAGLETLTFDGGKHTAALDGESYWGHAEYVSLERDGRLWNFDLDYWAFGPTYRADNGFQTSNDTRRATAWSGLFFRPAGRVFDEVIPQVSFGRIWNFRGVRKDEWLRPQLGVQLKAQTWVSAAFLWSRERFRDEVFGDIRRLEVNVNSDFSELFTAGFWFSTGRSIARNLATPVLGRGSTLSLWSTLKPLQRLVIEPQLNYSVLHHPDDGSRIFEGYILRTRFNYQLTRELFLRTIVQYNDFSQQLSLEPLLSYKVNPFTVFFVGSSHRYRDFGEPSAFTQTDRQFFVKLQYLVRT